ncbi:MAG: DMT family transporter [bacterium]|nr:DMT family transporter [bacterium]
MTENKKANMYMIGEMILWSLFPVVGMLGLNGVPAIVSLFWVNLFATLFFVGMTIFKGKLFELKNKQAWIYTIGTAIFIGVIFYGLFFYALGKTTPANAAIVTLFEIVPAYIFFQILKKEHFSKKHMLGILLATAAALIVLLPKAGQVNTGDLIIIIAVFFPPFGNWCQQQTRKIVSTESALFMRHVLSIPFLFLLAIIFETPVANYNINGVIGWLLLNGIVIFGISKIFWVEAIHRMSVTRGLALNSLNPIFTMLYAWILISQKPTWIQVLSLPLLIVSVLILTDVDFFKKRNESVELID